MAPTAASPAVTVPEIVWLATLEVSAAVLIATVGASVSSVNTTGVLVPVLPAASVSWATMEWAPSPDSVTVVVHTPPEPTVAVPIWVVTPPTVSSNVTVAPTAASAGGDLPEIVWLATLEVSAAVLIATVGASVSSVNTTAVLVPVLPAASVSWATMEWAPSPDSVTVVVHTPPEPTVAVPISVVTPLTVSSNVTVAPTAACAGGDRSGNRLARDVGGLRGGADRNRRGERVEREHDRRAGAGVAGGIGVLGDDGVGAIARQRDGGGPHPARAHGRGADLGGDAVNGVEQRHGGADRGLAGA